MDIALIIKSLLTINNALQFIIFSKGLILMKQFHVIHFKRKQRRQFGLFLIASISLAFFIYYGGAYILNFKAKPTALIKGNTDEKQIALTFNISWGDEKVYDILDVLKEKEIRATFFVSGEWAERHPQILDEITEQKHELGMLGYRYKNYLEQELTQVRKDIVYARNLFEKLGYPDLRYIRPPSGLFNEDIISLAKTLDLEVVHWSIASDDWKNPGIDMIVNELNKGSNGDIVLLHASDAAKQTAAALKIIIEEFKKKNFSFVTISQLKDGVTADESIVD